MSGYDKMFEVNDKAKQTPLLVCHGTADEVVKFEWGKLSYDLLIKAGVQKGSFKAYKGMPHSACGQELNDIAAFIADCLPKTN